jgi:hypothetical protein
MTRNAVSLIRAFIDHYRFNYRREKPIDMTCTLSKMKPDLTHAYIRDIIGSEKIDERLVTRPSLRRIAEVAFAIGIVIIIALFKGKMTISAVIQVFMDSGESPVQLITYIELIIREVN